MVHLDKENIDRIKNSLIGNPAQDANELHFYEIVAATAREVNNFLWKHHEKGPSLQKHNKIFTAEMARESMGSIDWLLHSISIHSQSFRYTYLKGEINLSTEQKKRLLALGYEVKKCNWLRRMLFKHQNKISW